MARSIPSFLHPEHAVAEEDEEEEETPIKPKRYMWSCPGEEEEVAAAGEDHDLNGGGGLDSEQTEVLLPGLWQPATWVSFQKMASCDHCGRTFGPGANECNRMHFLDSCCQGCGVTHCPPVLGISGARQCSGSLWWFIGGWERCCKCCKQRVPSWNFEGLACFACKNRQRELQTPQAPPASATAASAGAASNEAAPLIQPCKTNTIRVGSTTTLDAHLERVYLRRSASCSSLRGDGHGRPWRC